MNTNNWEEKKINIIYKCDHLKKTFSKKKNGRNLSDLQTTDLWLEKKNKK